jgi:hypothetical protein
MDQGSTDLKAKSKSKESEELRNTVQSISATSLPHFLTSKTCGLPNIAHVETELGSVLH